MEFNLACVSFEGAASGDHSRFIFLFIETYDFLVLSLLIEIANKKQCAEVILYFFSVISRALVWKMITYKCKPKSLLFTRRKLLYMFPKLLKRALLLARNWHPRSLCSRRSWKYSLLSCLTSLKLRFMIFCHTIPGFLLIISAHWYSLSRIYIYCVGRCYYVCTSSCRAIGWVYPNWKRVDIWF